MPDPILVAQHGEIQCHLLPALANRIDAYIAANRG